MKHALLALSLAAALAGGVCASPSSFVGMGTNTGTPSGDVRALQDHVPPEFLKVTNDLVRNEDVDAVRPDFAERAVRPFRIVVQSEVASDPSSRFLRVTKEFLGKLYGYQTFSIYYLDSADLGRAVQDGLADFIIAEPTFFTAEGPMMNVDVIASMRSGEAVSADETQGSVIFTKKRSGAPARQPAYLKKDRHDEYADLPVEHPESYRSFMNRNLFDHIDIDKANTHVPDGLAKDKEAACAAYTSFAAAHPIDVQILGIGANGHIGFNEPGTSFDAHTHLVELKEGTRRDNARFFDNDIDKVPTHAVTLGLADIIQAKMIILIANGTAKAEAVKRMIQGPVDVECPASLLQTHPCVYVVVDEAAGYYVK